MRYFANVKDLEELRKEYKKLLKRFHPDQPEGSEEATKAINAEYEMLFESLKNSSSNDTRNDFNEEFDNAFRGILSKIIDLNVDIEIIGSWIWLSGNTYVIKETLKRLGFRWINSRNRWAWHSEPFRKTNGKKRSMNELRNYYGSKVVKESSEDGMCMIA